MVTNRLDRSRLKWDVMTTMNNLSKHMKKLSAFIFALGAVCLLGSLSPDNAFAQKSNSKAATKTQPAKSGPIPVDRIAAVVNNDVVTEIELQQRVHQMALNLRRQKIQLPPMEALRDQVLERMIVERVIAQKAKETGLRIDDSMLNGAIEQIAHNNGVTVPQLEQRLKQDGISFNAFKNQVYNDLLTQRLREKDVDDTIQIPESEIDQYIKDQLGPEKRREYQLSRIVIAFPQNPSQAKLQEAQDLANNVLNQANRGVNFGQLAARYSRAPEAMEGGQMGWIAAGNLPPLILEAIKKGNTGDIIPVRTNNSFQIFKINAVRDPGSIENQSVEQTHVRHIMMRPTDVTPENVVIQRLKDLKDRLDKGDADFQTLARLHSADPSGTRGGDLGWLYPGDVPPEMEDQIKKLSKGEISEPIKTPYGWHIFQVLDRRSQSGVNERLRQQARESLRQQKLNDAVIDWEQRLVDQAYVEKRINKPEPD